MKFLKRVKSWFWKPHHHKWLWNAGPNVDPSKVEVTIYRYETRFQDGTAMHSVKICKHAKNTSGWIPPADHRYEIKGISASRYRELLRGLHLTGGNIHVIKSRIQATDDESLNKTTVVLDPSHDPSMDTWIASYWTLVDGVWLHNTYENSCIRATLGHVLDHSKDPQIAISGYRNAGLTIDRDEAAITYALFRDSYGILGVIPNNWYDDDELLGTLPDEMKTPPPRPVKHNLSWFGLFR